MLGYQDLDGDTVRGRTYQVTVAQIPKKAQEK